MSQQTSSSSNKLPAQSEEVFVNGTGLARVGAREGLFNYLASLWKYRHFILFDSRSRIAGSASEDSLGQVWLVANPILNGLAFYFVFGILLQTNRGIEHFVGYLIIGVFMFRFTVSSIVAGSKSITSNRTLVTAFNFPKATLPIAVNVRELLRNIPAYIAMFLLILVFVPVSEVISWRWLMIFPLVIVQFLFNLGLSFVLARMVTQWNDMTHLITFGTRIWMYMSAIFYGIDRFEHVPWVVTVMHLNPLYSILNIARNYILYAQSPEPLSWIVVGSWTVVLLIFGFIYFWQGEESYGKSN